MDPTSARYKKDLITFLLSGHCLYAVALQYLVNILRHYIQYYGFVYDNFWHQSENTNFDLNIMM